MKPFVFLGYTRNEAGKESFEVVYIGFDGQAGQDEWNKVISEKKFTRGERHYLSGGAPLPVVPSDMKGTTPKFAVTKPVKAPGVGSPPKHMAEAEEALRKQREEELNNRLRESRFFTGDKNPGSASGEKEPAAAAEGGLKSGGPTLEEYIAAGYQPDTYPPSGYAEVPSPGLDAYRAAQSEAKGVPEPPSDTPPEDSKPEVAEKKTGGKRRS